MGLTGTYLTGKKYWWSWLWLSVYNALWGIYAVVTGQYGFLLATVIYGGIYIKNAVEWRRELDLDPQP
jgi:hypothetical protein